MIYSYRTSFFIMEFALISECVCCSEGDVSPIESSAEQVHAKATHVTYYALDQDHLVVEIHALLSDSSPVSLEIDSAAFDFLTHLVNGAELRIAHPGQPDIVIHGADAVLSAWRDELRSDGIEANPNSTWFEQALWHLEQPCSLVTGYNCDEDIYYLTLAQ